MSDIEYDALVQILSTHSVTIPGTPPIAMHLPEDQCELLARPIRDVIDRLVAESARLRDLVAALEERCTIAETDADRLAAAFRPIGPFNPGRPPYKALEAHAEALKARQP